MENFLERHFHLSERKSSIGIEMRAGLSTFLTMSYILLLNPKILAKIGIPVTDIVVSTALSSAFGCFISGFFGNLPFGLAPGVGLSTYLTFGMVLGDGLTLTQAYTSCFIAGILLWIFAITGMANIVIKMIPKSIKLATIVGMGLQIAVVGMTSVNMIVPNEQTIIGLGDMENYKMWFTFFGLILIGSLLYHQVPGGILIGIMIMTIITWTVDKSVPSTFIQVPRLELSISDYINFSDFDLHKCLPAVVSFLFVGIIDLGGVIFGMSSLAKLTDEDGNVPGSSFAFLGASVGTLVGACTGSTPLIVYVESATGIKEGGRTGLSAIFMCILFLFSLVLAPLFGQVPATATAPVSILVGAMMISQATEIDWDDMSEAIPAFLTLIIMPITFSITNGILFGLLAAILFYITTGRFYDDIKLVVCKSSSRNNSAAATEYVLTGVHDRSVAAGAVINENEGQSFIPVKRTPSFMSTTPVVRTPSLILGKDDAGAVRRARGQSVDETQEREHELKAPTKYSSV